MNTTDAGSTSKGTRKREHEIESTEIEIADPAVNALLNMKNDVCFELVDCNPDEELEPIMRALQYDFPQASQIKKDIMTAFQQQSQGMFKNAQLHSYGSIVMGLAFRSSDLDFYVELPDHEQSKSTIAQRKKMMMEILKLTKKFSRFHSIKPHTMKCTHIDTLTNCDFNFASKFGVLNGPIVGHLLQFDDRIYGLAMIIKYWTKIHNCNGINLLSSYSVVWMLIFYLQTLPEPIIPPIRDFQQNVSPVIDTHRNFAFDYTIQNQTENRSHWMELLLGFFEFYRDFDYESQLICPLYGKTFSKLDVLNKEVKELQTYEHLLADDNLKNTLQPMDLGTNSLSIQDPFDIFRRIPGDILDKDFRMIVFKFGYAAKTIEQAVQTCEVNTILLQLFDVFGFEEKWSTNDQQDSEQPRQSEDQPTPVSLHGGHKIILLEDGEDAWNWDDDD